MITNWRVFNFKSVRKETSLEFAPLTIFAGANSSGKSTVLQTILLIAQTLAHKVSSRSVVLNGAFTRLGQFDDLRSLDSDADQIVIGWTCRPNQDPRSQTPEQASYRRWPAFYGRPGTALASVSCEIAFDTDTSSARRDVYQIQPRLFSSRLSAVVGDANGKDINYEISVVRSVAEASSATSKSKWHDPSQGDNPLTSESLSYDVNLDEASLEEIREEFVSAQPIGCVLRHFLPERLTLGLDMLKENAHMIIGLLTGDVPRPYTPRYYAGSPQPIPDTVMSIIADALDEHTMDLSNHQQSLFSEETKSSLTVADLQNWVRRLPNHQRMKLRRAIQEVENIEERILDAVRDNDQFNPAIAAFRPPQGIMEAASYLDQFFTSSVRYLGPLRDEPKAIYPLSPSADPTDVGLRGEHTAAVLDLYKDRRITYVPSTYFSEPDIKAGKTMRTLETAVVDWLKYLGVAEGIESTDRGKLGHELKVSIVQGKSVDLTHVGVGVSQVLPILVSCLLADTDTTLIFEQPELHLHPKVQTLLGDFFLSMAMLGKQCLVETHSEYLINRLRFRSAAAREGHHVESMLKIYFVERENGESAFRDVQINQYGAILDWPDGFFDQSQSESESILRAAAQKRKREREQPQ